MAFSRSQKIILGIGAAVILFFVLGALGVIPVFRKNTAKITVSFWGIDDPAAFKQIFLDYQEVAPNVTVEYTRFGEEDYEERLIDALAAGEGPDLFMFHSGWLPKHSNKIVPFPEELIGLPQFRGIYPQVAEADFVQDDRIYALPLYIDTLALIYNRDTFDFRKVALPPTTWTQFRNLAFSQGVSTDFGATSDIAKNSSDILSLLMLQSGVKMVDDNNRAVFASNSQAISSVNFYTQFNPPRTDSLKDFSDGKIGMILGYQADLKGVQSGNPYLNVGLASSPQFFPASPVNFSSYYGLAVAKKGTVASRSEAQKLAEFIAVEAAPAEQYLKDSGRPPALRSLIQKYSSNLNLGVFCGQALTARDWPEPDRRKVSAIFDNMLTLIESDELQPDAALRQAQNQINQLIGR
jgi:ABC-type glycerol-3-phosphate transport system substrate-binding protein